MNPLLDVTNDFYGWSELKNFLKEKNLENEIILGSRYQTVSQAAFALGKISGIAQIPRDIKQKSEWDELGVTSDIGPEWPMLKQSVLYVADNRYNEPPRYTNASCFVLTNFYYRRSVYLAKTITIWKCKDL
ncbi:MAG: hypothetical protein HY843_03020 [Bdellovibrio sp.]|nr:hypothetical protein [Bdellovibrio sp.]